jgi:hypothetical protein
MGRFSGNTVPADAGGIKTERPFNLYRGLLIIVGIALATGAEKEGIVGVRGCEPVSFCCCCWLWDSASRSLAVEGLRARGRILWQRLR